MLFDGKLIWLFNVLIEELLFSDVIDVTFVVDVWKNLFRMDGEGSFIELYNEFDWLFNVDIIGVHTNEEAFDELVIELDNKLLETSFCMDESEER